MNEPAVRRSERETSGEAREFWRLFEDSWGALRVLGSVAVNWTRGTAGGAMETRLAVVVGTLVLRGVNGGGCCCLVVPCGFVIRC